MAKIDNVQRLTVENFDKDHQDTVAKIAEIYNYFAEQVTETINGRIDINNLDRQLIQIEITVDSNGIPSTTTRFKANAGMRGSIIVRALNKTNASNYVSTAPFMSFTPIGNGIYNINKITGLEANNKYSLLIELIP